VLLEVVKIETYTNELATGALLVKERNDKKFLTRSVTSPFIRITSFAN